VEFGFPVYGYDWLGNTSKGLDWQGWAALVESKGPARRDAESAELVLKYDGREAWFCDSVSLLRKWEPARRAGIARMAFWVLGSEDPRIWEMLEEIP
jgi:peptidoglycan-N-acetylglucosamine deacetylase